MSAMSLYSSTNVVILGFVASSAEVGIFSAALRLIIPIRSLVGQLSTAVYPYVSRMAATEPGRAARFVNRYALLLSSPFLFVGIGLLAGGPLLARIGFGKAYTASGPLLQILAVSPFLLALSHCFATYYMLGFGYTRQWARLAFGAGIVNFAVLGIMLAIKSPAVAAAITMVALDVFVTLASYVFYLRTVNDHARPVEATEHPVLNAS
jgi:polysaccharide transporter, PST family